MSFRITATVFLFGAIFFSHLK